MGWTFWTGAVAPPLDNLDKPASQVAAFAAIVQSLQFVQPLQPVQSVQFVQSLQPVQSVQFVQSLQRVPLFLVELEKKANFLCQNKKMQYLCQTR